MNVAVIGASDKAERYSYQAFKLLQEKGHTVYPVHQRIELIDGVSVFSSIKEIPSVVDTVTMYVAPDISNQLAPDILAKKPKRIIFNPGAENPQLAALAQTQGIKTINACTLVMLRTGQF
jgi:uncharacterized protein